MAGSIAMNAEQMIATSGYDKIIEKEDSQTVAGSDVLTNHRDPWSSSSWTDDGE